MFFCKLGLHRWGRWGETFELYLNGSFSKGHRAFQRRACTRCGIIKDRCLGWASPEEIGKDNLKT